MKKLVAIAIVLLTLAFAVACSQQKANTPDAKPAVQDALKAAGYNNINVDQDRDKGVITLKGDVPTEEDKAKVAQIAQNAANGMVVSNEVGVRPEGNEGQAKKIDSATDDAIEDHMKAAIAAHRWENQHIRYDAKNGVLTLKGDVDTARQREQVNDVAKNIPGVQQVVNELQVKGEKQSAARHRNANQ
ncbi:MAG: BON domain-containing protein [Terriglobales bacterium]